MKIYKHISYDEYKQAQIEKNELKLNHVWVKEKEIIKIVNKIKHYIPDASFGICHGVRNAWEVRRLRKLLKIDVIGTDIAPSASKFDHTIQWDFHEIKEEWINNVDFIYSNSFDHAYDPKKCLDTWMKCIKVNRGICFIHWTVTNVDKIDSADCFGASLQEYIDLFSKKYQVVEQIGLDKRVILLVKHKGGSK
jgi:hypothetical protein